MPVTLRRTVPIHEQERRIEAIILQLVQREIDLEILTERLVIMGYSQRQIQEGIDRLKISGRLEELQGEITPK